MASDWGLDDEAMCGGTPDDLPELGVSPKVDDTCELWVAMAYDGKVLVIDGPEEFTSFVGDGEGSFYFNEGVLGPSTAGVYFLRVKFCQRVHQTEDGWEPDFWFEEVAWKRPGGEWQEIEGD